MSVTESTSEIRALAREFASNELRPHVEKSDHDRALDARALQLVAELGFLGMLAPEASGGMGMDVPTYIAALEELAWGEPAIALTVANNTFVTHVLSEHGSTQQQEHWIPSIAAGQSSACVAL